MSKKKTATLWGGPHRAEAQEALDALADWLSRPGWIARPGELGKRPDRMRITDHRVLTWPPKGVEKDFWVIQFWLGPENGRDWEIETGIGVVFPPDELSYFPEIRTFATRHMTHWPVEDVYAQLLASDLAVAKRLTIDDSVCGEPLAVDLAERCKTASLERARRLATAVLRLPSQSLRGELIVGEVNGVEMLVVLDSEGIQTYSSDEFFGGVAAATVLEIHMMRKILGFPVMVDRRTTHRKLEPIPPDVVVERWRKQEKELRALSVKKQEEILHSKGPRTGVELTHYARALKETGPRASILETIEWLESVWRYEPEASRWEYLGRAADICGFPVQAEKYLTFLRENYGWYFRRDQMHPLVKIYHGTARPKQAKKLLLDCISGSLRYARECTGMDRLNAEREYQAHRRLYVELFPEGAKDLRDNGLPEESW